MRKYDLNARQPPVNFCRACSSDGDGTMMQLILAH
jgi:hypothetical protein